MAKIRTIMKPALKGTNVTLSEARSVFREIRREAEKKAIPKVSRLWTVTEEMVGHTFAVRNGSRFVSVYVTRKMVGHRLGEFVAFGSELTSGKVRKSSKSR
ncbi:MAG TPA: ribosomal protein S19 family protein [Thermoanaerobaculia bacterium]|jgi:ribosomal protein S19|nr:ribosomal protein S19 family protein [Thermoanaerobaculia bacterium]